MISSSSSIAPIVITMPGTGMITMVMMISSSSTPKSYAGGQSFCRFLRTGWAGERRGASSFRVLQIRES